MKQLAKVKKIKYFTLSKKKLISEENIKLYEKYRKSNIIKNKEVEDSTYLVYKNYFEQFLVFLAENYNNIGLYSDEFMNDAVDIMEEFISFCQDTLLNHKKVINTKISAVSSFYLWSLKRGYIDRHPFDKKLDRMKGATEEKIINSYFLNDEQIKQIRVGLLNDNIYDIQDQIIFELMLDSANRIGAIDKLTLSSLDLENMMFTDIREKRGYRVEVTFTEKTKVLIEEWLEMRNELDKLEIDSLFISKYNGEYHHLSKSAVQRRIKKIGNIIGIEDYHSHCMRKTSLNDIYEKTGDLSLAAEMGNHKSIETTRQSYIKPVSKTEIRDKINKLRQQKINDKQQI